MSPRFSTHYAPRPFAFNPNIAPIYFRNPRVDRPFIGFSLFGGVAVLGSGAEQISNRMLTCITNAALGETNLHLLEDLQGIEPRASMNLVTTEMSRAYDQLQIPKSLGKNRRTVLFAACLAQNVFKIEKAGNPEYCEIPYGMRPIVTGISKGLNNDQIRVGTDLSPEKLKDSLDNFGYFYGLDNRVMIATASLLTEQILLSEVWPTPHTKNIGLVA